MGEVVDGEYQKYAVESGAYVRNHFWGADPRLLQMVAHLSDEQLKKLTLGGHDPVKVFAAYKAAVEHKGQPTVILARTIKGYGIGEAGEGKNITHQQKKLNEDELKAFRTRFGIPIGDDEVSQGPVLPAVRQQPRGHLPHRAAQAARRLRSLPHRPGRTAQDRFPPRTLQGIPRRQRRPQGLDHDGVRADAGQAAARTPRLGSWWCRSCPTRRAPSAWRRSSGRWESTRTSASSTSRSIATRCSTTRKPRKGRSSRKGINEAGSLASFIAAGSAYATHGINTIPFFIYYSMFGMQRVGDLVWAAADTRTRGFLLGGTAGRTTLAGEGLQHQDGHSHLLALAVPNLISYDPTFAFEIAVIIEDGIRRMYRDGESVFYYITVMNETYEMLGMPEGAREGILKGMYGCAPSARKKKAKGRAQLLGSGAILNEVLKAQAILDQQYDVAADVWSVTSYQELYRDGHAAERWNRLHPGQPRARALRDAVPGRAPRASSWRPPTT